MPAERMARYREKNREEINRRERKRRAQPEVKEAVHAYNRSRQAYQDNTRGWRRLKFNARPKLAKDIAASGLSIISLEELRNPFFYVRGLGYRRREYLFDRNE